MKYYVTINITFEITMDDQQPVPQALFLAKDRFQDLLDVLISDGFTVVGPTVSQGAIVYDEVSKVADLPCGLTDEQEPGKYRLVKRSDSAYFGYVVGPHSWKKYLFPSIATVASATKAELGWRMQTPDHQPKKRALLGVRACEIAALAVQDRVFLEGPYIDPLYRNQRDSLLIIAMNCTQAASTCFCTSMKTGPRCTTGFDLGLTELVEGFVIEVGSPSGKSIIDKLTTSLATSEQLQLGDQAREQAVKQISKQMDNDGIRDLLLNNLEHPRWNEVAQRCLSCTNCTMVCPTCFCSTVTEVPDLTGDHVDRVRKWDSCFNIDFSYTNGGTVRKTTHNRYRQWMTHKLATWFDQFGTSGCVGCGRCITWCPVGIDITEEVAAIRKTVPLAMTSPPPGSPRGATP